MFLFTILRINISVERLPCGINERNDKITFNQTFFILIVKIIKANINDTKKIIAYLILNDLRNKTILTYHSLKNRID